MASYNELKFDWSMLCQESSKWTLSDLQLAAELGKTLLERNKELESSLKQHQSIIDDQAQEIEYLTKQTTALREVNDSRLRIYENLEVSISDLERANHRLVIENASDKKNIKALCHTIETLETRCEDLSKQIEDLNRIIDIERRKKERLIQENANNKKSSGSTSTLRPVLRSPIETHDSEPEADEALADKTTMPGNCSFAFKSPSYKNKTTSNVSRALDFTDGPENFSLQDHEEVLKLMTELEIVKKQWISEQQRVLELEEQLISIIQENQTLQSRLVHNTSNEEMKSVHEELSILEEVRQGQMCSRCLRMVDDKQEESSIIGADTEDDDRSLMELLNNTETQHTYRTTVTIKDTSKPDTLELNMSSPNPYRVLVERYEALLEEKKRRNQALGIQDEFAISGDFSSLNTKDTDEESATGSSQRNMNNVKNNKGARRKTCLRTPTDFSEAETLSSGFSDETSNKATQTEERPGSFLCTIADGEDCKFSIYDDASPIGSRFRNRPEYRELFKEIFAVLKKAAENRDEGEKLPLLDDTNPALIVKVPPVTPATEDLPDIIDDNQSIASSIVSEQSVAMSERITKIERKSIEHKKHVDKAGQENKPPMGQIVEGGRVLTPYKRQPLEYLSVSVNVKKKHRKNRKNGNLDRSDSPAALPSPPKVFYTSSGKKRREMRPFDTTAPSPSGFEWNGSSIMVYNRSIQSPATSSNNSFKSRDLDTSGMEFRPSTASQDLHKLKKLDLSYAEVLRRADQHWKKH